MRSVHTALSRKQGRKLKLLRHAFASMIMYYDQRLESGECLPVLLSMDRTREPRFSVFRAA